MAAKKIKSDSDQEESASFENEPSQLDESTHTEMRMLYKESVESIRFAKTHQWGVVGATLLLFGGLLMIAYFAPPGRSLSDQLSGSSILIACGAIFILIIYQFWQHNEFRKLNFMGGQFSSLFREVRALKSAREANVHRYTFLIFMISMIILGAILTNVSILKIMRHY